MTTTQAVIFDMYETLVINTTALWVRTFDAICRQQGLPLTGQQLWDRWKPVELRFRKERLVAGHNGALPPFKTYRQAWTETFQAVFGELGRGDAAAASARSVVDQGTRDLYPEAKAVLAQLKASGRFRLGLLSNADDDALGPLLRRHRLRFDAVLSSEGARAYKPLPQPFRLIAESLKAPPEACLYVGDSQLDDVQGPKGVGMKAAWVNRRGADHDPSLPRPDYEVRDLAVVLQILGIPQ